VKRRKEWENVGDAWIRHTDKATIHRVNPRQGKWLYALRLPGSRGPIWLDTLKEAQEYR
jgi:hypothetical protein